MPFQIHALTTVRNNIYVLVSASDGIYHIHVCPWLNVKF